jgi:hypothetical protein
MLITEHFPTLLLISFGGLSDFDKLTYKQNLRKMGVNNWKQRTQERKKWKEIIEQAKTHKEL